MELLFVYLYVKEVKMKIWIRHKWLNLKNSWDNKKRLDDIFDKTFIDEATIVILVAWMLVVMIVLFNGCTTMKHEPSCICECNATSSYFECGGNLHHEEIEIK